MFYGLNNFIKKILPKRLFYRSLTIVVTPIILLQIIITIVFFDSLWIKTNKGMTRALVNEISTFVEAYNNDNYDRIMSIEMFEHLRNYKLILNLDNQIGIKNTLTFNLTADSDNPETITIIADIPKITKITPLFFW